MDELDALLAPIAAFHPGTTDDWRPLDRHVQAVLSRAGDLRPALPVLLGVFERFPRHDGHGVFWTILLGVEQIPGYEAAVLARVQQQPTELGLTLLQRLVNAGVTELDGVDLVSLIAALVPAAPVVDYTFDVAPTDVDALLAALARFQPPPRFDADWRPLLDLVATALAQFATATDDATRLPVVAALLDVLDRFRRYDGFAPYWTIVHGLEALPAWPSLLVALLRARRSRSGVTLLLRILARAGVALAAADELVVDGIPLAAFAAERVVAGD